jgi:beta-glucanase (GH16 family)
MQRYAYLFIGAIAQMAIFSASKKAVFGSTFLYFFIRSVTPAFPTELSLPLGIPGPFPSVGIVCNLDLIDTGLTNNGWTKTFEDNFYTLDKSQWYIWEGGSYNNELQCYQDSVSNLKVVNGVLKITAKEKSVTCDTDPYNSTPKAFDYTSGRIESSYEFAASVTTPTVRIYARIKLPAGYGMWAGFWSYGDPWPTHGEIDILEARGQEHTEYQTNFFYGSAVNVNEVPQEAESLHETGGGLTSCYHIYYAEWTEAALKFFIDGVLVDTKNASTPGGDLIPEFFGQMQHITLNLAVGGNFFEAATFDPTKIKTGTMYVDWVKVFTR